ncbi:MAG TPA: HAD-IA family hydrolase, partial [Longimicrobiaceae bacterium]|nr:HAD-IA family hydrolase [Longimicrobiaceae bacterium]
MTSPLPGIRAVLYDFDGTLADSTELIMRCYRHTMRTHLGEAPPDEEWLRGFGTPLETQIARFARSADEHQAMLASYRAYQDEHHDTLLQPFPGAAETVAELARRGLRLAIVTSKLRRGTLRGMDLCGITELFPVIVTPEDVRNPKPHPDPVRVALERLGVAPREALFVGDSPHDLVAGREAGTRTAAALWGPFPREALL